MTTTSDATTPVRSARERTVTLTEGDWTSIQGQLRHHALTQDALGWCETAERARLLASKLEIRLVEG